MATNKPLVDQEYLLEKFQAKGGWTYVQIPEVSQSKDFPFGQVRVRGTIDDYPIKNCNLMPMGKGRLFLPVKTEIRKKINKQAGDHVRVTLFADDLPTEIPEELRLCLLDEPKAFAAFLSHSNGEQKALIDWVYSAKTDKTKVDRIAKCIDKIVKRQKPTKRNYGE